jgi:vomeronasal 2 receptor
MPELKYFNYEASNCKIMKNYSSSTSLEWLMEQMFDMDFSDSTHNIYNAVYAMAHALYEKNLQQVDNQAINNEKGSSSGRVPCIG